jgi:hypothetical protein
MVGNIKDKKMSESNSPKWLKPALEFGPILLFFVAYLTLKDQIFTIAGTASQAPFKNANHNGSSDCGFWGAFGLV